jgi:hypothetical protein
MIRKRRKRRKEKTKKYEKEGKSRHLKQTKNQFSSIFDPKNAISLSETYQRCKKKDFDLI